MRALLLCLIVGSGSLVLRTPRRLRRGRRLLALRGSAVDGGATEEGEIGGVVLNEEMQVTVQFLGSAASRQRRVRRTRRPPPEERWRLSAEPAGYRRMSSFCVFDTTNLEELVDKLAGDVGFRQFGERISITSYTDVVHCRFVSPARLVEASMHAYTHTRIHDYTHTYIPCIHTYRHTHRRKDIRTHRHRDIRFTLTLASELPTLTTNALTV